LRQIVLSQLYFEARALSEGSIIPPRRRRTKWSVDSCKEVLISWRFFCLVEISVVWSWFVVLPNCWALLTSFSLSVFLFRKPRSQILHHFNPLSQNSLASSRIVPISVPFGCCSPKECVHPRVAFRQRSGVAGLGEFPPCPGSCS
jgi:hypothetical protein